MSQDLFSSILGSPRNFESMMQDDGSINEDDEEIVKVRSLIEKGANLDDDMLLSIKDQIAIYDPEKATEDAEDCQKK